MGETFGEVVARTRAAFEDRFKKAQPVCEECSRTSLAPRMQRAVEVGERCTVCLKPRLPSAEEALEADRRALLKNGGETNLVARLEARGIPWKDIDLLVADDGVLEVTKPLVAVREWYAALAGAMPTKMRQRREPVPYFLLLCGSVGIGKTTACSWFIAQPPVWHALAGDRRVTDESRPRYIAVTDMQSATLRDTANLNLWKRAVSLAIDDLGAEADDAAKDFKPVLNAVLEFRYRNLMPTILTSNLSAADLKARYGDRFFDRLREAAGDVHNFDDPSRRGA